MPHVTTTQMLLLLLTIPPLILTLHRLHRLLTNYHLTRTLNPMLPILILPFSWQDPLWQLLSPHLLPLLLHFPLLSRLKYTPLGWTTRDKARTHLLPPSKGGLGGAFALVSPNRTEFFTADPLMAVQVSRDWRAFERPRELYRVLDVMGRNVASVNGGEWQRMRKVVGGAFREGIYGVVWVETGRLVGGLVRGWVGSGGEMGVGMGIGVVGRRLSLGEVRMGTELLAMHVLSAAAFGRRFELGDGDGDGDGDVGGLERVEKGHEMSYLDCMRVMLPNLMGVIFVGGLKLPVPEWLMPKGLRRIKKAVEEYRRYLFEAVQREQQKEMAEHDKVPNLATLLVRANDAEKEENLASGTKVGHLSDEEQYGNIFMFNFAGFETTAMALSFCIANLALYPEVQAWAREEIDMVLGGEKDLSYEAFEKLPRVRALMAETLRLYSPVAQLPRQSPLHTTTLEVPSMNMTLIIPPDSLVSTPIAISGYIPNEFNGPDPYIFDPKRFIVTDEKEHESLRDEIELLKYGYMPFTTGPRACPGKKFSQVEFSRFVASLLSVAEVRVTAEEGERGLEEARDRLKAGLADTVFNLGLRIKDADRYQVEFVPRGAS